jgi:hypothetical protein
MKEYQFIPLSIFEECAAILVNYSQTFFAQSECFSLLFHLECNGEINPASPMRIIT